MDGLSSHVNLDKVENAGLQTYCFERLPTRTAAGLDLPMVASFTIRPSFELEQYLTSPTDARSAQTDSARLGLPLIVVATAQLMLVLDDTIANIALPSIQRQFGVPDAVLPWIINAYVLAFGSLLLFGGRMGDLYGRRRILRLGLALFSAASLLGGLGLNAEMLIASRGLQGVGAALVAPNVLAES